MNGDRTPWRLSASGTYWRTLVTHPKSGEQVCQFEHDGRTYLLYCDAKGTLTRVYKRECTNARGAHYVQLAPKGTAARKVQIAFTEAGHT